MTDTAMAPDNGAPPQGGTPVMPTDAPPPPASVDGDVAAPPPMAPPPPAPPKPAAPKPKPVAPAPAWAPAPAPTVKRVTTEAAMSEIREAVSDSLAGFGAANSTAQAQMAAFMAEIQPDVEEALASADLMSLGYIRDRIIMRAGRVSLGLIHQHKVMVANTIVTVLRILIKVAIGSVAPVGVPLV